ncbi:MAG: glycosyltransferase family 2 protein [Acidobacteria bacterium]|nr:glycosyltransferase family 2 protein [Acidobacteriota bacterium]MBV9476019.1 glycosyltransferase family 2 protein [Acidobacteriota bacterium]
MPRVTVIMATWNWSTVLPYSIGSVLGQTMTDFELLVVGDGCTDDSEAVVRAVDDPRVRWINLPQNTGHQSGPNNEGLRQARGEFIAYLGHDDLWLPHHLEVLCAALDRGADLAHTLIAFVPPPGSGRTLTVGRREWKPPSSVMHRRSATETAGGWRDYRGMMDTPEGELWARIEAAGFRVEFVPRLTVIKFPALWRKNVYRQRPCEEQKAWLARIRAEPDLELVELAKIASGIQPRFSDRLLRLLRSPSEWPSVLWRRPGARIRAWQRYKGVRH